MGHNRFGLHWANVPIDERLKNLALSAGGDCYLVIDGAWGIIPKIREARPNAIIVQRHAVANWMDMKPEQWAAEMRGLFQNHKKWTRHVELECEPDIFPSFPGWGQPIIDRLKFAADWNVRVADWLRNQCPGIVIHSPPLAHERLDLSHWFQIWKPVLDACDVLDMHCYWEKDGQYFRPGLYDPEESYHRAFRYRKIHDFLESQGYHIPMMVTECGNFAPDRSDYADELIYYFSQMQDDADYVVGGCVFILKSNKPNWVNDLTRQPNIERFLGRLRDAPKKQLPYPGEGSAPMKNPITVGIRKDYKDPKSPIVEKKAMEMEEYLRYCVLYEVYPSWKPEALKAQAVAARTYAEYRKKHPKHEGCDLCNSTCCQVMGPNTDPRTDKAVKDTEGIVITRQGQIINAEYSANCGGKTESGVSCQCWEISPHGKERYGHGRGMCQWGAQVRALEGDTFEEILWHYYPGCAVGGKEAPPPEVDNVQEALKKIRSARASLKIGYEAGMKDLDKAEEYLS